MQVLLGHWVDPKLAKMACHVINLGGGGGGGFLLPPYQHYRQAVIKMTKDTNKDLRSRIVNVKRLQNGSPIICNSNITPSAS